MKRKHLCNENYKECQHLRSFLNWIESNNAPRLSHVYHIADTGRFGWLISELYGSDKLRDLQVLIGFFLMDKCRKNRDCPTKALLPEYEGDLK